MATVKTISNYDSMRNRIVFICNTDPGASWAACLRWPQPGSLVKYNDKLWTLVFMISNEEDLEILPKNTLCYLQPLNPNELVVHAMRADIKCPTPMEMAEQLYPEALWKLSLPHIRSTSPIPVPRTVPHLYVGNARFVIPPLDDQENNDDDDDMPPLEMAPPPPPVNERMEQMTQTFRIRPISGYMVGRREPGAYVISPYARMSNQSLISEVDQSTVANFDRYMQELAATEDQPSDAAVDMELEHDLADSSIQVSETTPYNYEMVD